MIEINPQDRLRHSADYQPPITAQNDRTQSARMNWRRGFLRGWVVFAILWILLSGWSTFEKWASYSDTVQVKGDCWDRLAKWQDGTPLDGWDAVANDSPSGSSDKDQWRAKVRIELVKCEAAKPLMQRVVIRATDVWSEFKGALPVIFAPPFALLILGSLFYWILRGFWAVDDHL